MTTGDEDNGMLCPPWLGGDDDDETMVREKTAEVCAESDTATCTLDKKDKSFFGFIFCFINKYSISSFFKFNI